MATNRDLLLKQEWPNILTEKLLPRRLSRKNHNPTSTISSSAAFPEPSVPVTQASNSRRKKAERNWTETDMLSDDILCADSYLGFRELLMKKPGVQNKESNTVASLNHGTEKITSKNQDESKRLICDDILDSIDGDVFLEKFSLELITPNVTQKKAEDQDFVKSSSENKNDSVVVTLDCKEKGQWDMQKLNETTPERSKSSLNSVQGFHKKAERNQIHDTKCARKRLFPSEYKEGGPAPKSLKLIDIYQFLLKKSGNGSHHAECDVLHLLECIVALSSDFIHWTDENAIKLSNVKKIW